MKKILIVILIVIAMAFLVFKAGSFVASDRCLDSGGEWDADMNECEYEVISN